MDQTTLKKLLDYDPQTGLFKWRVNQPPRGKLGERAGCDNGNGYVRVTISGAKYYAHRLAFLWVLGTFPEKVDHINGNRRDNRWCNLRDVSQAVNMANTVHGRGVRLCSGRWHARYSNVHLGVFDTRQEAEACYQQEKNRRAGLMPHRSLTCGPPLTKRQHTKRTYLGKSLSFWARTWGVPQPTLHHQIVVQGRSFDEIAALKGTTKSSESAEGRGG